VTRGAAADGDDPATRLAFKAYEIEELADVYVFRPLGMVAARVARSLQMTPTAVTIVAAAVGMTAGLLLVNDRFGILAFALLMVHSVLDSSDGQLARMTGRTSDLGRMLDGLSGYLTHAAIYSAILWRALVAREPLAVIATIAAAASNIVHAQMYDYYRNAYEVHAISGLSTRPSAGRPALLSRYEAAQSWLARGHEQVERRLSERAVGGRLSDVVRQRYRRFFYSTVRGWNVLGDNTRFYAIGLLAWQQRIDWYPAVVLVGMNAVLVVMIVWQARRDRLFLAGV
jgi:phosphatidylglycerophosphate synthase